jgi:hypothetical protein
MRFFLFAQSHAIGEDFLRHNIGSKSGGVMVISSSADMAKTTRRGGVGRGSAEEDDVAWYILPGMAYSEDIRFAIKSAELRWGAVWSAASFISRLTDPRERVNASTRSQPRQSVI